MNSWSRAERPTGGGSGDTALLMAAHTVGDTSQSTLQHLSVANAVSSSAVGDSQLAAGETLYKKKHLCKKKHQVHFRRAENCIRSCQRRGHCARQSQQKSDHTKITSYRRPTSVRNSMRGTLCKVVNRTVLSRRRKKPIKLSSRNTRIQIIRDLEDGLQK